ncbi:hypothetical protein TM1040_2943 [Ruegeria sp. TM1040]|nr:hypothetical protein TM1040_2943 [Ruegeria sp. TM1040]
MISSPRPAYAARGFFIPCAPLSALVETAQQERKNADRTPKADGETACLLEQAFEDGLSRTKASDGSHSGMSQDIRWLGQDQDRPSNRAHLPPHGVAPSSATLNSHP